jgi:hypothetical protein
MSEYFGQTMNASINSVNKMLPFTVYIIASSRKMMIVRSTFTWQKGLHMNQDDELQARSAFVWASDYGNQNTAALLGRQGVKTFGEVADMSPFMLLKAGLVQDEVYGVSQMLAKRGLVLKKDDDFDDSN